MKKNLIIYYVLLLGLLSTWNSPELPPMIIRLLFLVLSVAPLVFNNTERFPCILSTFVIISANRYVPSYMPFLPIYIAITTIMMMSFKRSGTGKSAPLPLIILLIFTCFVNLLKSSSVESISITTLIIVLFYSFIDNDLHRRSREISISLVVISFFLCLEILIFKGESTYSFTVGDRQFDRVGWNDPNYFSSIIGMGAIASLNMLLSSERLSKLYQALLISVIMLVIVVSLMIASRGAILAMFVSIMVLLIFARRQSKISSVLLLTLFAFIIIIYQNGSFNFLITRFINDAGEIGGRDVIWRSKLADFSEHASFLDLLIGLGHKEGLALASYVGDRAYIGFHNDYIAMSVSYGLIGLILMIAMYLYPIFKYKDPRVTATCLYIMIISISLEPLYSGGLAIFYFYFYVCVIGEATSQGKLLMNDRFKIKC